jgi:hypothetical protein
MQMIKGELFFKKNIRLRQNVLLLAGETSWSIIGLMRNMFPPFQQEWDHGLWDEATGSIREY